MLAVHRSLAQRPMHDAGHGRVVVPLLQPAADDLPFAVALELHRCSSRRDTETSSAAQQSSYQLHYVLLGEAQVNMLWT